MEFFNLVLLLFIAGTIVYTLRKRKSKLEIEKGLNPLFTEYCCGAFDGYRAKFLRLSVYNDFLVIGYSRSIVIKAKEIKSVSFEKYFGAKGLKVGHNRSDLPNILLFLKNNLKAKQIIQGVVGTYRDRDAHH